jgi:hypothetical protein
MSRNLPQLWPAGTLVDPLRPGTFRARCAVPARRRVGGADRKSGIRTWHQHEGPAVGDRRVGARAVPAAAARVPDPGDRRVRPAVGRSQAEVAPRARELGGPRARPPGGPRARPAVGRRVRAQVGRRAGPVVGRRQPVEAATAAASRHAAVLHEAVQNGGPQQQGARRPGVAARGERPIEVRLAGVRLAGVRLAGVRLGGVRPARVLLAGVNPLGARRTATTPARHLAVPASGRTRSTSATRKSGNVAAHPPRGGADATLPATPAPVRPGTVPRCAWWANVRPRAGPVRRPGARVPGRARPPGREPSSGAAGSPVAPGRVRRHARVDAAVPRESRKSSRSSRAGTRTGRWAP